MQIKRPGVSVRTKHPGVLYFSEKISLVDKASRGKYSYYVLHLSRAMRKPAFCLCENKDADQLRGTAKLISAFVFAT